MNTRICPTAQVAEERTRAEKTPAKCFGEAPRGPAKSGVLWGEEAERAESRDGRFSEQSQTPIARTAYPNLARVNGKRGRGAPRSHGSPGRRWARNGSPVIAFGRNWVICERNNSIAGAEHRHPASPYPSARSGSSRHSIRRNARKCISPSSIPFSRAGPAMAATSSSAISRSFLCNGRALSCSSQARSSI